VRCSINGLGGAHCDHPRPRTTHDQHSTRGPSAIYGGPGIATTDDADDHITYNTSTGDLYYDPDGSGGTGSTLFATLTGAPAVNAADFYIVV